MAKTSKEQNRINREKKRARGLKPHEIWVTDEEYRQVRMLIDRLRGRQGLDLLQQIQALQKEVTRLHEAIDAYDMYVNEGDY